MICVAKQIAHNVYPKQSAFGIIAGQEFDGSRHLNFDGGKQGRLGLTGAARPAFGASSAGVSHVLVQAVPSPFRLPLPKAGLLRSW
jgi:hypothetical protein